MNKLGGYSAVHFDKKVSTGKRFICWIAFSTFEQLDLRAKCFSDKSCSIYSHTEFFFKLIINNLINRYIFFFLLKVLAKVSLASVEDVDKAVAAAKVYFSFLLVKFLNTYFKYVFLG